MTDALPTPGLTGSPLDRVDHLREDAAAIAALTADPRARLLLLDGLDPLVDDTGRLLWTPLAGLGRVPELALLGLIDGIPCFATPELLRLDDSASEGAWPTLDRMPAAEASTYAAARSLVDWHRRHGSCAQCGTPTRMVRAGWGRQCDGCGAAHFPRTDPVVIMLAEHDGHALLGRQPSFPEGFFSALAGFIEVGESIEEAVVRELREEAGVAAHSVRYVASQPWPFPSSLMIACIAQVDSFDIKIDTNELETAGWYSRAEVRAALDGAAGARFVAPPAYAIAHTLLARWANRN